MYSGFWPSGFPGAHEYMGIRFAMAHFFCFQPSSESSLCRYGFQGSGNNPMQCSVMCRICRLYSFGLTKGSHTACFVHEASVFLTSFIQNPWVRDEVVNTSKPPPPAEICCSLWPGSLAQNYVQLRCLRVSCHDSQCSFETFVVLLLRVQTSYSAACFLLPPPPGLQLSYCSHPVTVLYKIPIGGIVELQLQYIGGLL